MALKIFNYFFCIVFIVFAALQYNDPDPYIWVPIYLYTAILCYFAARQKFYPTAYFIGIVLYLAYGVYKFFDHYGVLDWMEKYHSESLVESMKAEKPWIEETREFFGLLILVVVLAIDWFYYKRKVSKK